MGFHAGAAEDDGVDFWVVVGYALQRIVLVAGRNHIIDVVDVLCAFVAAAYKEYVKEQNLAPEEVGLVVVHDELEEKLGVVKTRMWQSSPRGHNGVKSVQKSLPHRPDRSWARVTVGIGRPLERSKTTVSDFVLGKVPHDAKTVIEREASARLLEMLTQLERKWEAAAAAA